MVYVLSVPTSIQIKQLGQRGGGCQNKFEVRRFALHLPSILQISDKKCPQTLTDCSWRRDEVNKEWFKHAQAPVIFV